MNDIKELPDGTAGFEEIRLGNYVYADKTKLLCQPAKTKKPYFLSRPRWFGKSSLVSALEAILTGRRELFEGLWIHDRFQQPRFPHGQLKRRRCRRRLQPQNFAVPGRLPDSRPD
ncbi:MAG: AAA family ATPase [Deltaproteobacteria bacterium]|nr:AAA family ATPase [Deltaproteobacteria bacterium]